MDTNHSIKIINNSNTQRKYVIFSEKPRVSGTLTKIHQNVFSTARVPHAQEVIFAIPKQYHALCGNFAAKPADHVAVTVSDDRPVTLGKRTPDGTETKGTSWQVDGAEETLVFTVPLPANGHDEGLEIVTGTSFSWKDSLKHNYMIGIGLTSSHVEKRPIATFAAEPNLKYQITPIRVFYIAIDSRDEHEPGQIIDPVVLGNAFEVNFYSLPADDVVIVHQQDGHFARQK